MPTDRGAMIIRHPDREEVFQLESASLTAFRQPTGVELYFRADVVDPDDCPWRTRAEAYVYLSEFEPSSLPGSRFEIPRSYDENTYEHFSRMTYAASTRYFNNIILKIIDRSGDQLRVQWSGTMPYKNTEPQLVIDGYLDYLGFKPKFEDVRSPIDFIKPFPAHDDVFAEPMPLHRKHFLPLLSVNAAVIYDDLDCWLHFVSPIEPLMEGCVGDWTGPYHDSYNTVGQVALRFNGGKYSFTGDPNFFLYESLAQYRGRQYTEDEMRADYNSRIADYELSRRSFLEHAQLQGAFVNRLGGEPMSTNWGNQLPRTNSGKPFRWIGEIQGFTYCDRLADSICLYYDPEAQIALLRYDWS
jgi:hypothetical protein